MHFNPCGHVVDYARREYTTQARLHRDSDIISQIRWVRAAPGAPTLPFPSGVMSLDGHPFPWVKEGFGEVYGAPRERAKYRALPKPSGHICGTAEEHLRGEVLDLTKPPQKYHPNSMLPYCCSPARREVTVHVGTGLQVDWEVQPNFRFALLTAVLSNDRTQLTLTWQGAVSRTAVGVIGINGANVTIDNEAGSGTNVYTITFTEPVPIVPVLTVSIPEGCFVDEPHNPDSPKRNVPILGFPITNAPAPVVLFENGTYDVSRPSYESDYFSYLTAVTQQIEVTACRVTELQYYVEVGTGEVPIVAAMMLGDLPFGEDDIFTEAALFAELIESVPGGGDVYRVTQECDYELNAGTYFLTMAASYDSTFFYGLKWFAAQDGTYDGESSAAGAIAGGMTLKLSGFEEV